MKLSIVLPIYNEEENLTELYNELAQVFAREKIDYEIIAVDDGSRDGSYILLKKLAANDSRLKVLRFRVNVGQTAAMSAGMQAAKGDVVIPMDADLQNDPADIPRFLEKMTEGHDVVCGWRKDRKDGLFVRRVPSQIANWIIRRLTGVHVHDYGCTMKAFRREVITGVNLYGEMHRFIPIYTAWQGGKTAEIEVNHRPRTRGVSKYNLSRVYKVLLDLIMVKFLQRYMNKPMHFFGGLGFISLFLGGTAGTVSVALKLFEIRDFVATPLPIWSALFIIVGVQLIVMGIMAEILMRIYYEAQGKTPHDIAERVNID